MRKQAELKLKMSEIEDERLSLEQQLETGFKLGKGLQTKNVDLARHKQLQE
jgi:hypothetical protein